MTKSIGHEKDRERTLTCPMCGKQFICSLSSTCWCASKKIPVEVTESLAARYDTCVCSNCLDLLVEQHDAKAGHY
jgi:hypothetical protein